MFIIGKIISDGEALIIGIELTSDLSVRDE